MFYSFCRSLLNEIGALLFEKLFIFVLVVNELSEERRIITVFLFEKEYSFNEFIICI